jgi:hypothetical protein
LGSSSASNKAVVKPSPSAAYKKFNRSKHSRNGGTRKVGAHRRKRPGDLLVKKVRIKRKKGDDVVEVVISPRAALVAEVAEKGTRAVRPLRAKPALQAQEAEGRALKAEIHRL